ncbi:MAG: hypothetical protein PHS56_05335 [Eubacteriales bacterium]|jgi:hypothetical protein|nr:hypothetical protein [Eubacteriales bacterium]MDD3073835.1 hypothetical protein [Eubacteriales bacterium]MDD4078217.1 hypothetical protein [Eubacteriales bacterium]MDD4768791.1 hypothetical protein [Eubacteriales bacterium]
MRRAGRALGDKNMIGKLAGIALAVCGLAIIVAKVPSVFWWFVLGIGLIILGWKLFTC